MNSQESLTFVLVQMAGNFRVVLDSDNFSALDVCFLELWLELHVVEADPDLVVLAVEVV